MAHLGFFYGLIQMMEGLFHILVHVLAGFGHTQGVFIMHALAGVGHRFRYWMGWVTHIGLSRLIFMCWQDLGTLMVSSLFRCWLILPHSG